MTMAATNRATTTLRPRVRAMSEEARWILVLGAPFLVAAAFFMSAVGTGITWLLVPAIVAGPGVIALVFLALSADTNAPSRREHLRGGVRQPRVPRSWQRRPEQHDPFIQTIDEKEETP